MTKEINFNTVPLPKVVKNQQQRDKQARGNVNKAMTMFKGTSNNTNIPSSLDNTQLSKIDMEQLMGEPEIQPLTMEYLDQVLGKKKVNKETKERALEIINKAITQNSPTLAEFFRNLAIDTLDTMYGSGSRITLTEYMNACLFVSHRSAGDNQVKAYCKVFPERVMQMQREGQDMAHLKSYASLYNKSRAVTEVQAKTLVPTHLMCYDLFYEAMRVTADVMNDTNVSAKVRVEAANNIMNHTKQPEIKKQELDIKVQDSNAVAELKAALSELSQAQQSKIIEGNYSVVDVSEAEIITSEEEENW